MLNNILGMLASNAIQQNPMFQQAQQFFSGKSTKDQVTTLLNIAKERGFDIDKKMFTADDLKRMGLNIPPAQGK